MKEQLAAALDLQGIPQLSLGTAALVIFGICASLALLRGLGRILAGSLVLCASGFAGFYTWQHMPAVANRLSDSPIPWLSVAAPAAAGLICFLVLRRFLRFLIRPFGKADQDIAAETRRSPIRWAVILLLSLIPAGLLWLTGATALRNLGSVAEIRHFVDGPDAAPARSAFLAELKSSIDRTLPETWFQDINPLADKARVTLAKLIALGGEAPPPKAIPVLEEPQIRALILHDPQLRALAKAHRYADILRDPRLDHVMANPDLKKLLGDLQL
jgi:hypothetical protein